MIRPAWDKSAAWRERNKAFDTTVLICQHNTLDLTRLCLESLLRFYPDIPVLVVDTTSDDNSILYVQWKSIVAPNVRYWVRPGVRSHGMSMDDGVKKFITTKYVLLMDSDVISERGGYIEGMLDQFDANPQLFATGSTLRCTRKNYGCGFPTDDADLFWYPHPSCSLYDVERYKTLGTKGAFTDHGAPCIYALLEAEKVGWQIDTFPTDEYVSHLSGASWCNPRCVWPHDHDVLTRPFVTFVPSDPAAGMMLANQTDTDYDIVWPAPPANADIAVPFMLEARHLGNTGYGIRFDVRGEYVCALTDKVSAEFVHDLKMAAISFKAPDYVDVQGQRCYRRRYWQYNICLEV